MTRRFVLEQNMFLNRFLVATVSACIAASGMCAIAGETGSNGSKTDSGESKTGAGKDVKQTKVLTVTSTAFGAERIIPKRYTGDGKDVSPPLKWSAGPSGTKCYALSVEDPDAPGGTWWHWTLSNIPPSVTQLSEGASKSKALPKGSIEGKNDFEQLGYNGPMPPKGQNHHYHFKVVALSDELKLSRGCSKQQYETAIKGHILAQGELIGTYSH
jgi:Raf kinase inhibitor-like YbhB/YbcL family protein